MPKYSGLPSSPITFSPPSVMKYSAFPRRSRHPAGLERAQGAREVHLLVRGGEEVDVAVESQALALRANQGHELEDPFRLHVLRAPAVDQAVLHGARERRQRPVAGVGGHHVHVVREDQGAAGARCPSGWPAGSPGRVRTRRSRPECPRGPGSPCRSARTSARCRAGSWCRPGGTGGGDRPPSARRTEADPRAGAGKATSDRARTRGTGRMPPPAEARGYHRGFDTLARRET